MVVSGIFRDRGLTLTVTKPNVQKLHQFAVIATSLPVSPRFSLCTEDRREWLLASTAFISLRIWARKQPPQNLRENMEPATSLRGFWGTWH